MRSCGPHPGLHGAVLAPDPVLRYLEVVLGALISVSLSVLLPGGPECGGSILS